MASASRNLLIILLCTAAMTTTASDQEADGTMNANTVRNQIFAIVAATVYNVGRVGRVGRPADRQNRLEFHGLVQYFTETFVSETNEFIFHIQFFALNRRGLSPPKKVLAYLVMAVSTLLTFEPGFHEPKITGVIYFKEVDVFPPEK
ncbi:hypothetical protein AXF42_Ash017650 [Apostasia shenzhenica]|uniref:Uncharacterized protein n=1 Tax=Apostasia shenzhenica TaxID=1088818 RepID=A0A2I0A5E9_9ASPA|nr:hypothetical protein AXF42_Ash017650 [Apostasia shenzhenica]